MIPQCAMSSDKPVMTQQRMAVFAPSLKYLNPRLVGMMWLISSAGFLGHSAAIAQTATPESADLGVTQSAPSAEELLMPAPGAPTTADVEAAPLAPSLSVDELMQQSPTLAPSVIINGEYIDPSSDYNLGATYAPDQVSSVVLSERSTGCQAVFDGGQEVGAVCTPEEMERVMGQSLDGQSVNLGPISLSSDGITINTPVPSFEEFYSVTTRPISLPSNGDRSLLFPLAIPAPITSLFGWRTHPIFGDTRFHSGTDLGAPMGTPVVAAFSGNVLTADFMQGYGLTVILSHQDGTQETLYAHLSEIFVQPGDTVKQGDVIGRVGSTGNSTGPHLHFEVRELENGVWVTLNPDQSLQQSLNAFLNGFDGLGLAQAKWSTSRLQAGFAISDKNKYNVVASRLGQAIPAIARRPIEIISIDTLYPTHAINRDLPTVSVPRTISALEGEEAVSLE